MPQNTFPNGTLFNLKKFGGPRLASLKALGAATTARAALSTVSVWRFWRRKLEDTAHRRGPIVPAVRGRYSPRCWDTTPPALELEKACSPQLLKRAKRPWAASALTAVLGPDLASIPEAGLQKKLCTEMTKALYPCDTQALVVRRMAKMGIATKAAAVSHTLSVLSKFKPEVAMATLATMANGWITDRRMQESTIRPCLFGCRCPHSQDSLSHYLACEHLWGAIGVAAPPAVAPGPARCGIAPPGASVWDVEALCRRVATALHAYRTMRLSPSLIVIEGSDAAGLKRAFRRALSAAAYKLEVTACSVFGVHGRPPEQRPRRMRSARGKSKIRKH